ncbi:MAG: hypothetical protein ACLS90_01900 [Clostridia bacterium]
MREKIKELTQSKIFHICMIIVIITIIVFIAGMLVLRYNVTGEVNMPFTLKKIAIISSQEGIDDGQTDTKWSFDIYQANDLYLYIEKNNNYKKTELISEVKIDNFTIEAQNTDNIKIYKPDAQEENVIFKYKEENIVQDLVYTTDTQANLKNLKISNQGGVIAFRCSNNNIAKYKSDEEEINHNELLKKANIKNEDIEIKITFNLTIILEDGKKYAATISTKLPSGDVVENGNTSEEITDLKDVVFKRI